MRRQPKTSLDKRNCRFGMSKESQRYPQLTHRLDVVRRLCNSHFKLDPGIVQAPLCTTKHSHVGMSIGIVSIIAEKFDKQLFGSCFILLRSQSPAVQARLLINTFAMQYLESTERGSPSKACSKHLRASCRFVEECGLLSKPRPRMTRSPGVQF